MIKIPGVHLLADLQRFDHPPSAEKCQLRAIASVALTLLRELHIQALREMGFLQNSKASR